VNWAQPDTLITPADALVRADEQHAADAVRIVSICAILQQCKLPAWSRAARCGAGLWKQYVNKSMPAHGASSALRRSTTQQLSAVRAPRGCRGSSSVSASAMHCPLCPCPLNICMLKSRWKLHTCEGNIAGPADGGKRVT